MNAKEMNLRVLEAYSALLTRSPAWITAKDVREVVCGASEENHVMKGDRHADSDL